MSNLLPRKEKKQLITEYRVRLFATWLFMCAGACFITTCMLLPTYIFVSSELSSARGAFQKQSDETGTTYASTVQAIRTANSIGAQLTKSDKDVQVTDVLKEITKELGPSIQFGGFTFVRQAKGDPQIELQGIARTRDDLAQFVERLKSNPFFADAAVPFAQLAQASNAAFTATLRLRPPHKKTP